MPCSHYQIFMISKQCKQCNLGQNPHLAYIFFQSSNHNVHVFSVPTLINLNFNLKQETLTDGQINKKTYCIPKILGRVKKEYFP